MQRLLSVILSILVIFTVSVTPIHVYAGALTNVSIALSSVKAGDTGVSHVTSITTASTATLKIIAIRYSTSQGGTTKPAALNLTAASAGGVTGLTGTWTYDVTEANIGIIRIIEQGGGVSVASNTTITITAGAITNSAIDNCQSGNNGLQDTCHVRISTFDASDALVDSGDTTYQVTEDPTLLFEVEAVDSNETANGVTTTLASTDTSFAFGKLTQLEREVVRHKITVSTNAPGGYTISAHFSNAFEAVTSNEPIQPFGATNATWSTPQTWDSPDGTTMSDDTGWFGANTTDTRVTGWSGSTSNKFAPFGTTERTIAYSSGPDRAGTVIYVSYALEINLGQPADSYEGEITYNVQASY
jgi:hypothetical protein